MNIADINQLLSEKGNLCISMVVPTHGHSRERMLDPKVIHNAIEKAKKLLNNSAWPKESIQQVEIKLNDISEKIDYLRLQEGLAIFISPNTSKLFVLPFQVKEKVILGKKFEIRDLFYYVQFLKTYYLLAISKQRVPLFKCEGRDLQEIRNDDFPKQYTEEYEYAKPSIASSAGPGLQSYEGDKSVSQEKRQKAFMKVVDDAIQKYIKSDIPLLVAGVEEELSNFEHVTRHLNQVIGKIKGNYENDAVHALSEIAWKKVNEYVKASQKEILLKLQEGIGKKLAIDGLREVWKAAKEGKGLTLIVEKDYQASGYYDAANDSHLYLSSPSGKHEIIPDVIEDVIEVVNEKGGHVVIVENGELEKYGHVAMLLRYS